MDRGGGKTVFVILRSIYWGTAVGEALGKPVQLESRMSRRLDPVEQIRKEFFHGEVTEKQRALTLELQEAWVKELPWFGLLGESRRVNWSQEQAELGGNHQGAVNPGDRGMSLAVLLPLLLDLRLRFGEDFYFRKEAFQRIGDFFLHPSPDPLQELATGVLLCTAALLPEKLPLPETIALGVSRAMAHYAPHRAYRQALHRFHRLSQESFSDLPEQEIRSHGDVVETLEAALWCLVKTTDFETCVLKAVNLGGNTVDTGSLAGGLAALYYGVPQIPEQWRTMLAPMEEDWQLALSPREEMPRWKEERIKEVGLTGESGDRVSPQGSRTSSKASWWHPVTRIRLFVSG